MKIPYEAFPEEAKMIYDKSNKRRKVWLIISWVLIIILCFCNLGKDSSPNLSAFQTAIVSIMIAFLVGSIPLGIAHTGFIFKRCISRFWILGFFPWYLAAAALLLFYPIFVIIDTILFILRKPAIYPFEHKEILDLI